MSLQIPAALIIAMLGAGLLFVAILLLVWAVLLLMRLSARLERSEASFAQDSAEMELKKRAAAAAVAVALVQENRPGPHEFPLPPTPLVSTWQVVMRSGMLKKRGRLP